MAPTTFHSPAEVWALVRRQHGVIARWQLLDLGYGAEAISHRLRAGRLHPLWRGVYSVGRPDVSRDGMLMAAVLATGPRSALSHTAAGELWALVGQGSGRVTLSVPAEVRRGARGLVVHRRRPLPPIAVHRNIPVTSPLWTLVDLATVLPRGPLEAAVNAADRLDLIDPERLREELAPLRHVYGVPALRALLDRHTFVLTDSELERRFLPLARGAGLPIPETRRYESSFRVDFVWPSLGLIVETDGLRYHRTPAAQARDRLRDQAHTAAGWTPLRFTHAQVYYEPRYLQRILCAVAERLTGH